MSTACPRCDVPVSPPGALVCAECGADLVGTQFPVAALSPGWLVGRGADGSPQEIRLSDVRISIGRHPGCAIRLSDREVSKEHAVIERVSGGFMLRDLGSSNGSFINGLRIQQQKLRDGDELVFGTSKMTFRSSKPTTGGNIAVPTSGVTIVGASQSMPAFLAEIDQGGAVATFLPADRIEDIAALRQDYERLRIAHEFHRQVGVERSGHLLERILAASFELLPADTGVIFLTDPATGKLEPRSVHRRGSVRDEVVVSDTVLERVRETRQAVLTADAIFDSRFSASESIVAQGIRSVMAVPLLSKGALMGVLVLDSRKHANAFSEKDLKILSAIASQAAVALENAELAKKIEAEAVTRAELSRFLSPAVAEMVVAGRVELLRQGRLAEVSVLFADIRGFTTMAESESPQEVVSMLNGFFSAASKVIFRHEGNLDKFIGDCVMAVWGPPSQHSDDPGRALRAGLELQREVELLNGRRVAAGLAPIEVGVGINTGQAVVGYMGSTERHEFTAIGDSVNTASRLCSLAKGGEVIASEATVKRGGQGFLVEPMPASFVKGKERALALYRVLAAAERG